VRYDPSLAVNRFARRGQKRALLAALRHLGPSQLHGLRLLDVGCGGGDWFSWFLDLRIEPASIAGIELDPSRAASCQSKNPECDVRVADAADLPWPDGTFDVVFQSTVLSSVLDEDVRTAIAREMLRVTTPGGTILSYDFFVRRPGNLDVVGIGRRELRRLFPRATIETERVTLARPLAAMLARRAWGAAVLLESIDLFNTHFFSVIRV